MTDNALVIGSTGLVGSLLVNELTTKNISTIAVTRRPIKNNYNNNSLFEVDFNSALDNKKFPCTLGNQRRDFLYVEDLINLIIKVLRKKPRIFSGDESNISHKTLSSNMRIIHEEGNLPDHPSAKFIFNIGLNQSIFNNKPILLDFTGWACANCRRVEENTWSVPKVYDLINDDFILISLYVDDRTDLKKDDIVFLKDKNLNEKILDKVGEKWSAFQTLNFKNNSQPYYVLLSPQLELLNKPLQYTDTETYYKSVSYTHLTLPTKA